jgi:hypothetical protein
MTVKNHRLYRRFNLINAEEAENAPIPAGVTAATRNT